jgi:hypothetical protein
MSLDPVELLVATTEMEPETVKVVVGAGSTDRVPLVWTLIPVRVRVLSMEKLVGFTSRAKDMLWNIEPAVAVRFTA